MGNEPAFQCIQGTINNLYQLYEENGFVTETAILDAAVESEVPLHTVDRICDQLLSMGVIVIPHQTSDDSIDDSEEYDRSRTDYEQVFSEAISLDEGLTHFVEQVQLIQAPQHREWINLIPQAKNGNNFAYQRIIEMYLRVVIKVSLSYYKRISAPLADTIQEACIGLILAIDKYDVSRGGVFPTYFPWWIRQRILREIPFPINPSVYYPVHFKDKLLGIWELVSNHTCERCRQNKICPELVTAVSEASECSTTDAIMYLRYYEEFLSIDQLVDEDPVALSDNGSFMESLLTTYNLIEMKSAIADVLDTLTPREKRVLQLRFGLDGEAEKTLEQVGNVFGVTRERIRQIEAKAIRKLQHPKRRRRLRAFLE